MGNIQNIKVSIKGADYIIRAEEINNKIWFYWQHKIFVFNKNFKKQSVTHATEIKSFQNNILSPMPGQVIKILVSVGDTVRVNQDLLIISSMKMEYTLKSSQKGIIKLLTVKENDTVSAEQKVIEIGKINKNK